MITIIGFTLILLNLISIRGAEIDGYEVSIYNALNPIFWVSLIGSITCGITIIAYEAINKQYSRQRFWLIGLLIIMMNNIILLLLPVFRCYATYGRTDNLAHVGIALDIISTGHISQYNIYPATHILISSISNIINLPPIIVVNFFPAFFYVLIILGIYCLAKVISSEPREIMLITLASTVLLSTLYNSVILYSLSLSYFIFPLLLYLYFKELAQFRLLLIVLVILLAYFNPLSSIVLIFGFTTMDVFNVFYNKRYGNQHGRQHRYGIYPSLISFIILITWLSGKYPFWKTYIRLIYYALLGIIDIEPLITSQIMDTFFVRLNMKIPDFISLFIKLYGNILIYLVISLIAGIRTIRHLSLTSFDQFKIKKLFILFGYFISTILLQLFQLFATIVSTGAIRLLPFIFSVCPIFVGHILYNYGKINKKNEFATLSLIVGLILVCSTFGIFSTYPSPYTKQTNQQVTVAELNGMEWLYEYKNPAIPDRPIRMYYYYAHFLLGENLAKERMEKGDISHVEFGPQNVNYASYSNLGDLHISEVYIPLSIFDKVFYEVYPELEEFDINYFEKLKKDQTVNKIFSNGELEVWMVT